MNASLESALACLKDAQAEIAREFDLDPKTNLFGKQFPDWAAQVRDLIHAAHDHLLNAKV